MSQIALGKASRRFFNRKSNPLRNEMLNLLSWSNNDIRQLVLTYAQDEDARSTLIDVLDAWAADIKDSATLHDRNNLIILHQSFVPHNQHGSLIVNALQRQGSTLEEAIEGNADNLSRILAAAPEFLTAECH